MLRPSYSELMDAVMKEEKLDPRVVSRYTLVLAAAKRARQLTDGMPPLTYVPQNDRAVSIAVKELQEGKLKIKVDAGLLEGHTLRLLRQKDRIRSISGLSKDDLREELKDEYEPGAYHLYDNLDDADDDVEHMLLVPLTGEEDAMKEDSVGIYDEPLIDDELIDEDITEVFGVVPEEEVDEE